jgi:hypothetical protein
VINVIHFILFFAAQSVVAMREIRGLITNFMNENKIYWLHFFLNAKRSPLLTLNGICVQVSEIKHI